MTSSSQSWGFLTNHALVMIFIIRHPESTVREISVGVGVTERATLALLRHPDQLARLARRMSALVNLLPLHPGGAPGLTPTTPARIRAFADRLLTQGVEAVVRRSRGLDISAACGQLRVESESRPAHPRKPADATR